MTHKTLTRLTGAALITAALGLSACNTTTPSASSDACGASQYQALVGGPSRAAFDLDVPGDSRHYGRSEAVATNVPSRLNFVHSGTAVEAVADPSSTVVRVFCG
jgi:hypothetical protein